MPTEIYVSLSAWDWFTAPPGRFARDMIVTRDGKSHAYRRLNKTFLGYIADRIELAFERNLPAEKLHRAIVLFNDIRRASGVWELGKPPGNYRVPKVPTHVPTVYERNHPEDPWVGAIPGAICLGLDSEGKPMLPLADDPAIQRYVETQYDKQKQVGDDRKCDDQSLNRKGRKVQVQRPLLF